MEEVLAFYFEVLHSQVYSRAAQLYWTLLFMACFFGLRVFLGEVDGLVPRGEFLLWFVGD